jgi:hypothetical protein
MIHAAGRMFVALRKAKSTPARAAKAVYHAVTPSCRPALCGNEPGPSSQWVEPPGDRVTCPVCLQRLAAL